MPIESVLYLCLVIGAMSVFAVTVAYGDWVWQQPPRNCAADRAASDATPAARENEKGDYKNAA